MTPGRSASLAAVLVVAAVASVAWPLATYTLTLAAFGLAHVLGELRYVDLRFGARLGRSLAWGIGAVLGGIVLVRVLLMAGVVGYEAALVLELGGGVALVALVLPMLARGRPAAGLVGVGVAAVLVLALAVDPAAGLLAMAVLHNLTPVGFVLEATAGASRRRAAWACGVVFGVVPLVIALGWPWALVVSLGVQAPEASPLGYGPLQVAMRAYLPVEVLSPVTALHFFCACVFLQCAHYCVVLGVLPRLVPLGAVGWVRWPGARWWPWVLAGAVLAVVPFAIDFASARRGYGVLAAVHAWVELPVLLLALGGGFGAGAAVGVGAGGAGGYENRHRP
jgi:hypothetical protein